MRLLEKNKHDDYHLAIILERVLYADKDEVKNGKRDGDRYLEVIKNTGKRSTLQNNNNTVH